MTVSRKMSGYLNRASWIRKMFEQGAALKSIHGSEHVFDFSLGNPDIPPPEEVLDAMSSLGRTMHHGYMPNAGYPDVRKNVASHASKLYGVDFSPKNIIMSCGAGGGLNVVLKAIIDPGDEVIVLSPYFVEYGFYVENHGGVLVDAPCDDTFLPSGETIARAITERTRAIILNTPNNPSGRVYHGGVLEEISHVLRRHPEILVISDEPYRSIVYDGVEVPSIPAIFPNSVVVTSASKELSLAGERIGYIALSPRGPHRELLVDAMILATRILGFVNAPALMQQVFSRCLSCGVDVSIYQRRRDLFTSILDEAGLGYAKPEGTFYLFARSPIEDDIAFCSALANERILAVPGKGFGRGGYVRFAYCVDESVISGAAQGLKKVAAELS
ncbi:MAG TPA: pyridoxal phosphate-dependent aminotransferase [Deltaproteobacteria bacterium]|nr:pyridoxal phosphate-dependent aminotransferase [Deltaproteobacteria bacterium]